jgi:hypothetical protein
MASNILFRWHFSSPVSGCGGSAEKLKGLAK